MSTKKGFHIDQLASIQAMLLTFFVGLIFAVLSVEYETQWGDCQPNQSGEIRCANRFAWRGWSGVPLKEIGVIVSTGSGIAYGLRHLKRNDSEADEVTIEDSGVEG